MAYFVTGATGFIGRFLVANLLKRGKPIYVLVRKGSLKKLEALRERMGRDRQAGDRRSSATSAKPNLGVADADVKKLKGKIDALLPPRRDLRPDGERRGAAGGQRRRHAPRGASSRRRCGAAASTT